MFGVGDGVFSRQVKRRRTRMGLTQDQMEQLTGLDQAYLSRIERGVIKRPSVDVAAAIARALHCSVEDLLTDDEAARRQPALMCAVAA